MTTVATSDDCPIDSIHSEANNLESMSDYQHLVPTVEDAVRKNGKVRMLVQMHDFHGWDAGALWQDIKFDVKHFNHIQRLAIVGETTWEKWMAMFCKPFTTAKVRYFPVERSAEARTWVSDLLRLGRCG
jgi:hypothetical protein